MTLEELHKAVIADLSRRIRECETQANNQRLPSQRNAWNRAAIEIRRAWLFWSQQRIPNDKET